jgi:HAD superfamily hydrolase (TIGR01509 family)
MTFRMQHPVELVMWDLDGTLIHSEQLQFDAIIHACALEGMTMERTTIIPPGSNGKSVYRQLFQIAKEIELPARYAIWYDATIDYVVRNISRSKPVHEATRFCQHLAELGVRQIVVSNSNSRIIDAALRHIGIRDMIDAMHSADDVARGKPFPDIYLNAIATHGVEPACCLAFEDSATGISAARKAGVPVVAVSASPDIRELANMAVHPDASIDWRDLAANINFANTYREAR